MGVKTPEKPSHSKEAATSSEDAGLRTVFVRNLPYTFTDSQLQEVFSEIGPVRRSFTVKEKGSEQCRGFGYVQFAIVEDAVRAVKEKDGTDLQGRKMMVKPANRRPSFEERRTKVKPNGTRVKGDLENMGATKEGALASQGKEVNVTKSPHTQHLEKAVSRKAENQKVKDGNLNEKVKEVEIQRKEKHSRDTIDSGDKRKMKKRQKVEGPGEGKTSEKQKVARTVVLGGLVSPEMREAVIECVKKVGQVESVQTSLSPQELKGRGLEKDGCRAGAAAVVFSSVRAAIQAVAQLHGKPIGGGTVWARQLGGEGSKPRKWRVIIRNLPFSVTEEKVRELFDMVGFMWEAKVPRKEDGQARGFAFASFLSKAIAEKAIHVMNGKRVEKRPIAVDWAVEKSAYEPTTSGGTPSGKTDDVQLDKRDDLPSDIEDEETASEDEEDGNELEVDFPHESEDEEGDGSKQSASFDEVDLAEKVLNRVVSASRNKQSISKLTDMDKQGGNKVSVLPTNKGGDEPDKGQQAIQSGSRGDLDKTVFIKNLPFDVDVHMLKKQFSAFGKVKSTFLVLHPKTKRPKGTAFLEFVTVEAAEAALAAAAGNRDNLKLPGGIMLGGRQLEVLKAMEKKSAEAKEKEKLERVVVDRRNLYLINEGKIEEGTPAASGVSEEDMQKRLQLEKVKAIKLRSPNFHVSRTRLAVYNVPKSMKEAELRKLFIDAVKSRATKQHAIIKQVKILKDEAKADKSRGVAFVEYSEHQHALVALRVLNNNPVTFGAQRRPIVGFAIENLQTLRKRQERQLEADRKGVEDGGTHGMKKRKRRGDEKSKARKRKEALGDESPLSASETIDKHDSNLEGLDTRPLNGKRQEKKKSKPDPIHHEEVNPSKKRKRKSGDSHQRSNGDVNSMQEVHAPELLKEWSKSEGAKTLKHGEKKESKRKKVDGGSKQSTHTTSSQENAYRTLKEIKAGRRKKKGGKLEVEDKLEKLVAVYREKYFSSASKRSKDTQTSRNKKASSDLKRWFE